MSILTRAKKMLRKEEKASEKKKVDKKADAQKTAAESAAQTTITLEGMLTEKSMLAQERNTVVFRVHPKATKGQIAAAVKAEYGVTALGIRTANFRPKVRRRGMSYGFTNNWKKAYVKVSDVSKFNK